MLHKNVLKRKKICLVMSFYKTFQCLDSKCCCETPEAVADADGIRVTVQVEVLEEIGLFMTH